MPLRKYGYPSKDIFAESLKTSVYFPLDCEVSVKGLTGPWILSKITEILALKMLVKKLHQPS